MASAQVLRKQEHLEAGKRRLEEFRKKKAADRAKKVASSSQLHSADVGLNEKQSVETERVRVTESDGAGTSDGSGRAVIESSVVVDNSNDKAIESPPNNHLDFSTTYNNSFSTETVDVHGKDHEFNRYDMSGSDGPVNVYFSPQTREKNDDLGIYSGASGRGPYGTVTDQSIALRPQAVRDNNINSSQSSHYGLDETESKDNHSYENDFKVINPGTSRVPPENSGSNYRFGYGSPLASTLRSSSYKDSIHPTSNIPETSLGIGQSVWGALQPNSTTTSSMGERQLSSFRDPFPANSVPQRASESQSTDFSFDVRNSTDHVSPHPTVSETSTKRSRPSFLDAINVPRVSALENSPTETERVEPFSKLRTSNVSGSFEHSTHSSVSAGNGSELYRHRVDENTFQQKDDFFSRKQDEDFSALEQHIEDLTQEKFSLQRALEASRALAESLATENSSLTDSYNQQGSVVNQLKADMEKLQEEIKAELVELESLKIEYANAQLECNAADERSKLLASEVIGLEEKALRLRSSELKLERQLENSQAEIASFRKRVSSLEKERQDFQSTIDALQEEKKLLQAKLRKASVTGKHIDAGKNPANKKDVSTSTEDLDHRDDADTTEDAAMHSGNAPLVGSDASSFPLPLENGQLNLEVSSSNIPPDQIRMIQNINTLISELALEKEELMQALVAESSQSSQLKDLNKELSRRLEAQTQRLELLTAQSMANESVRARQPDSRTIPENTPYADEGDEVVERVLGWIMKLFPGGPSKRRTSKLL